MQRIIYVFVFLFICQFCSPTVVEIPQNPYASWAATDPGLRELNLPARKLPWKERVYRLDELRRATLAAINAIDEISLSPSASTNHAEWKEKWSQLTLPKKIQTVTDQYLYGVYFVENLGSSALTGIVRSENGDPLGGIIFFDTEYLAHGINTWASKKEESAFLPDFGQKYTVELSKTDTREETLKFLYYHELGHILATVLRQAPDYSEPKRNFSIFPLFEGVWISELEATYDQTFFPERKKIRFYTNSPKLVTFPEGKLIYKKLKNTAFVSLYAATNADDTFAEAFAQYVHVVLEGKDVNVRFQSLGNEEIVSENLILKEGARRFREYFQSILD